MPGCFFGICRVMVELMSTEKLDAPIADDGKMLVSGDYIEKLIAIANKRLVSSRDKIERLKEKVLGF